MTLLALGFTTHAVLTTGLIATFIRHPKTARIIEQMPQRSTMSSTGSGTRWAAG